VRDTHLSDMRKVGRGREFEDELLPGRIPAFELLEPVADVAAEDDRAFVGLHDDDLMSGRVSRRRQEPDARQDLRLAVVLDVRRARKVDPLPRRVIVRASASSRRCTWIGMPGKSRLPPQWSKWVRVDDDRDATHELPHRRSLRD